MSWMTALASPFLGNDQRLSPVAAYTLSLGGMRLEKADGLDPRERLMVDPALRTKQSLTGREHEPHPSRRMGTMTVRPVSERKI